MNPVYLYYPNLIGYTRIILLFVAGYLVFSDPFFAVISYLTSMGLDAVDGTVARYFNQSSSFGAQLDMLTDRMTTTCLYVVLAQMYPSHWYYSAIFIMLDIVSHWLHMMSKLEAGNRSHKTGVNEFLRLYYGFPYFMLALCIGQELFLIKYFLEPTLKIRVPWANDILNSFPVYWILFTLYILKQYANFIQMIEAIKYYADKDLAQIQQNRNNINNRNKNKNNKYSNHNGTNHDR